MSKLIEVMGLDLTCDNNPCDYSTKVLSVELHKYINARCPKCAGILLTDKEYASAILENGLTEEINTYYQANPEILHPQNEVDVVRYNPSCQ